jgi:hypothetical protein
MTNLMEKHNSSNTINKYRISLKYTNEILKTLEYPTARKLSKSTKISIQNMRKRRKQLYNAATA